MAFSHLEPFGDEWRQAATIAYPSYVALDNSLNLESLMPLSRHVEPIEDDEQDVEAEIARTNKMFARKGIKLKDDTAK